jgi:hypothetical protein
MVPGTGLEPARLAAVAPKATASTNSAIPARAQLSSSPARRIRSKNSMIGFNYFRSYATEPIVARTSRRSPSLSQIPQLGRVPALDQVLGTKISAQKCAVLASAAKRAKRLRHLFVNSARRISL